MQIKENKKLIVSLLISFIVIASFTGIIGYISTSSTKASINQLVGQQSTSTAFNVLNKIDISIATKILELKKLGKESLIQNVLIISNNNSQTSIDNKIISDKLDEKIQLDTRELGYKTYENIMLQNNEGQVIAFSGNNGERILEDELLVELRESEILIDDVYYDEILNEQVYFVGILILDTKGNDIGFIHALINFEEIMMQIDESREESEFTSSEFDLFYDDGFLLYSTAERPEDHILSNFIGEFEDDSEENIDDEFENLDEQYDKILREFGYKEPELTEEQWNIIESKLHPLDKKYEEILEKYESENISEAQEVQFEEELLRLDLQYNKILEDSGFTVPVLSEQEQLELDEKLFEIEEKYEEIYEKYDFDFTFGGKGFVIVDTEEDKEVLHSYSRQKGYQEFEGFDWILVVHTEMDEILQDVNSQRESLLVLTVLMTITAALLGVFFARIFYNQSRRINENEKMSTIGHLSSNIAHDMRNPLGAIRSSTERIKDQNKNQNKTIADEVNRINRSVKRMSHQIEGVLNYVRTTPLITDEFSVLEMLDYAKKTLEIPDNIKIILPKKDIRIECDQEKLEITFLNLMLNAIQAIDEKKHGVLEIKLMDNEKTIQISFSNNGPPIPDTVRPRIFEPLFTTHLKGTGLGLSSCKNIIEQHNGKITVKQDPVTFIIQIPKKQS